jgi:hypothetical protein
LTVAATVPKQSGFHDKLLYSPSSKVAVLLDYQDGKGRCYQLVGGFHASHTFTAITVDATRTFTWHDGLGFWTLPWDDVACVPF